MKIIDIYPDELFYSYIARYRIRMNHLSFEDCSRHIYVYPQGRPECLFTNILRPEVFNEITAVIAWKDIIRKHTMISEYRFLPADKFNKGYRKLIDEGVRDYKFLLDKHIEERKLMYCPICAKEERKLYGEAYWHRIHQIRGMKICPLHQCFLHESRVTFSRHCVVNIFPAESEVPLETEISYCENRDVIEAAHFYKTVFEAPVDIEYPVPVGKYLSLRLPDKYRYSLSRKYDYAKSGANDIAAIHIDFSGYMAERGAESIDASALQKVYNGQVTSFSEICDLALFEGVSAKELTSPEEWEDVLPYKKIYRKVADDLGIDYHTVEKIGDKVIHAFMHEGRVRAKSGRKEVEWDQFDREMLPKVKKACRRIYGEGNERPQKVTLGSIYKEFELPQRRLDKMPLCKAEVLRWNESPLEYWAREVVWAYKQAELSPGGATKTRIQRLTNTKNRDYERYKPFLAKYADADTLKQIIEIMEG